MKIKFTFLFLLLILSSCHTYKLTVTEEKGNPKLSDTVDYAGYWTKMLCAMPERQKLDSLNDDYRTFALALTQLKHGEFDSSESNFYKLFKSSNDTIRNYSRSFLSELLDYREKYQKWTEVFMDTIVARKADTLKHRVFILKNQPEFAIDFKKEIDTLPVKIKNGHASIIINKNGKKLKFLIDTGCDISLFTEKALENFNYKELDFDLPVISFIGTTKEYPAVLIDSISIGNVILKNLLSFKTEKSDLKFKFLLITFLKYDGIIGWNLLKNLDFEIDQANEYLIIRKPVKREITDRNLFWYFELVLKLTNMAGSQLLFNFDTGATSTSFYDLIFEKMVISDTSNFKQRIYSVGGSERMKLKRITELPLRYENYILKYKNLHSAINIHKDIYLDGNFGFDLIKKGRVRVDAFNGRFDFYPEKFDED